jgi:putative hydrolase of the HAD superfamily
MCCLSTGHTVSLRALGIAHAKARDSLQIPIAPDRLFYSRFNRKLLAGLSVPVTAQLSDEIFNAVRALTYVPYGDTRVLNALGIPMGIVSNWDATLPEVLERHFSSVTFSPIVYSYASGFAKPDPRIFRTALEAIAVPPETVVYVGDSVKLDIVPAQEVGMRTVLVDRNSYHDSYSGVKVSSLRELVSLL